uniref:Protein kinase domain-containing protein n=1 Tax=Maylandia zebra TaxID=106582 RepID=A0A3P9B7V5_9CICH
MSNIALTLSPCSSAHAFKRAPCPLQTEKQRGTSPFLQCLLPLTCLLRPSAGPLDLRTDIWALLHVHGKVPYFGQPSAQQDADLQQLLAPVSEQFFNSYSNFTNHVITLLFKLNTDLTAFLELALFQSENGHVLSFKHKMLALDANQRITPSEVLKHPFFDPGLSRRTPCTDMNSTGGQLLVLSQQPSSWKSHGSQKFSYSFQNSVEFPQKRDINTSANPSASEDDLQITEGTILGDQHVVEAFLGEGGFGLVTRCRNTKNNKTVAIKVNKSDPEILLQAKLEIFILEQLRRLDPDRCNIVEWNGYFLDGERICLNFELLDQSLWDYIGDRNNQGLPMRELRPILHQLANALFHLGSVGIVHADLKPGNIMVMNRSESPVKVKLIDFGLACPASAVIPGDRVGTIGYCAPEVMLGIPYNKAIDMWSLGLVAVELATGVPLYPGEDDYDVLKFIIETQGQLPDHLLESEQHNNRENKAPSQ